MAIRTYNFTFDVKRSIMPEPVFIRQNDSTGATLINVHLVDNGVPVKINGDLEFRAMTADSQNVIADTTGFSNIDIDKGTFSYALPNQLSMTPGKIRIAYFMMVDASGNASTLSFVIFVKPSADLTPSGAKNYISIIDGLIKVFNEWNETAHSSWQDFVNANKEIIESVDPGGALLTEVINARTPKNKPSYATLGERLNDMPSNQDVPNIQINDNIRIGATVSSDNQTEIDTLKSEIDQDLFNFVFISDVHYDKWSDNNKTGLDRLNNALALDGAVDTIISGGDNVDGGAPLPEIFRNQTNEYVNDMYYMHDSGSDKFILKGNHDDASGKLMAYYRNRNGTLAEDGPIPIPTTSSELKQMYANNLLINDEVRDGMSNYFYKDYVDKKIRLIGLDSNDIPDNVMNDDDRPKYYGIVHMGYQQRQLDWLANVALQNVPADFTTVIVAHVHADAITSEDRVDDHFHDMYYNVNLMTQIVNDFKNGRSSTVTGSIKDWGVSLQTDFTDQGPRTLAGFIHGHRHLELFNNAVGFNNIGITCSIDQSGNQIDAWDVVTVDTANRKLILKGFGRATDREYNY